MRNKLLFLFALLLLIFAFVTCKQNENDKLSFDEEDSSFLIRDFSIKAIGEEAYTSVPLEKLKDGSYLFTSIDTEIEVMLISNINLKTATMGNDEIRIDDKTKKVAYGKTHTIGTSPETFTIELSTNNGMSQLLSFKARYVKNHIRGLKIKLDENIYSINDLNDATLKVVDDNANIEVISRDVMTKVELKDETVATSTLLEFADGDKRIAKGRVENISETAKKITCRIEALNREDAVVTFSVRIANDGLNIILRSLEYFDKSPFNLDKTKFTKDTNGIYTSQNLKFSDWNGQEVLFIAQTQSENIKVKYSYSDVDVLPNNFIPMPKKYVYSKWNNSGGVAPNDYLSLKDVFNMKFELRHGVSYLFLCFENNKIKIYYKVLLEREKEDASLCEFIKLSPRRIPLIDYYDEDGMQPSIASNGIHEITYIFKLKNPRGSIKFYSYTRNGKKEIEAKKMTKGEYKGCYFVEINPLAKNSETYCEAYAVSENGRVATSSTDPKGVYTLSVNNLFLAFSYEDNKDKYKYPSMPNYIMFDRNKIIDNKLFVRVIVPKILKNDVNVPNIQPTPTVTDLPTNMSEYSAHYVAYKLVIDVSGLLKGKKLDITMPIKNTSTNKIIFTHLITVGEE